MAHYLCKIGSYTGDGNDNRSITVGFQPDLVILQGVGPDTNDIKATMWSSTSMGGDSSGYFDTTIPGFVTNRIQAMESNGFQIGTGAEVNTLNLDYIWIAFKNGDDTNEYLDTGSYTGNATDDRNITAPGFQPTFTQVQGNNLLAGYGAVCKIEQNTGEDTMIYNSGADIATNAIQDLISTGFQVGTDITVNTATIVYQWWLFKALTGKIATGTYTGDGNDNKDINIGFKPAMVFVKRDTSTGSNSIWRCDSMSAGESYLVLGISLARLTTGIKALNTNGFRLGTVPLVNASGSIYRYIAIAGNEETTKTLTSDAYILTISSDTINSDANIKIAGEEGTLISNYFVKKHGISETITQDGFIMFLREKTINSDYNLKATGCNILLSDGHIEKAGEEQALSLSYYIKSSPSSTMSLFSNLYIKATNFKITMQDAWIMKESVNIINSGYYIKKLNNVGTITQEAHIEKVMSQVLNQDAYIMGVPTKTISSDYSILATNSATIIQNAYLVYTYSNTITSDTNITGNPSKIIYSDYLIKATYPVIITSNYYLKKIHIVTINQEGYIKGVPVECLTSDSYVKKLDNLETITQDAELIFTFTRSLVMDSNIKTTMTGRSSFTTGTISIGDINKNLITTTPTVTARLYSVTIRLQPTDGAQDTWIKYRATIDSIDYDSDVINIGQAPAGFNMFTFKFPGKPLITSTESFNITPIINQGLVPNTSIVALDVSGWNTHFQEIPEMSWTVQWDPVMNYYIKSLNNVETINSGSWIETALMTGIFCNYTIKGTVEKVINANYYIKHEEEFGSINSDYNVITSFTSTISSDYYLKSPNTGLITSDLTIFATMPAGIISDYWLRECGNWSVVWNVITINRVSKTITCDISVKGIGTKPIICDMGYVNKPEIYEGTI